MGIIIDAGIWLTVAIYKFAAFVFKIFLILASGTILEENAYSTILTNFYVILGIVMLFVLAFSILKGMVNPDAQKKGATAVKKIIVNLVTSIIILAVLPTIFAFAYDFQTSFIVEQNTIGKFFGYGTQGSIEDSPTTPSNLERVESGAYQIVNGVFTAFFNVNVDNCTKTASSAKELLIACQTIESTGKTQFKYNTAGYNNDTSKQKHTFADTIKYVDLTGAFGAYSAFSKDVDNEYINFDFLLCLIAGILLAYVGISFCFDMAIRLVKLVFYQLIAPIPIFFRIIPEGKLSDSFGKWLKVTGTCYLEVFIRIFVFYFCIFLCNEMIKTDFLNEEVYNYGILVALFTKAFILMGIITFMKQAPKLISDITGLDSGNMSLGIKDKLAAGGFFAAGAVLGGGATALVRNAVNAGGNIKNKYAESRKAGKGKLASLWSTKGAVGAGIMSMTAGGISGAVRSGKSGMGAKSFKDMKSSASSGASAAVTARDRRSAYKASHGGTTLGAVKGHAQDTKKGVADWAGVGTGDTVLSYYTLAAQSSNSFNDLSESTYKKKPEYLDQSSIVKALEAKYDAAIKAGKIEEAKALKVQLDAEKEILDAMQRKMAAKKADTISIAATRLSVDQRTNYSNDKEFTKSYREAIFEGFKISAEDYARSRVIDVKVVGDGGKTITRKQRILVNDKGEERALSFDDTSVIDAMLSGGPVDDAWISEDNVIQIQKAIDEANIRRQHIKTRKEREHIVRSGNRPTDKKDK